MILFFPFSAVITESTNNSLTKTIYDYNLIPLSLTLSVLSQETVLFPSTLKNDPETSQTLAIPFSNVISPAIGPTERKTPQSCEAGAVYCIVLSLRGHKSITVFSQE